MKLAQATTILVLAGIADAFTPAKFGARQATARSLAMDPSMLPDIPHHIQSLQEAFSTISLSDAIDALPDSLPEAASQVVQQAAPAAADVAADVAEAGTDNGWFGFFVGPTEFLLQGIHSALVAVGLSADAWGLSIIVMTLVIKALTFPLTKTQLESTNKMQVSAHLSFETNVLLVIEF